MPIVDYSDVTLIFRCDPVGQLTSALGYEPDGATIRSNENFAYSYDHANSWVRRYRCAERRGRVQPVRLLEAVVAPAGAPSGLLVQLPGGARLEIRQVGQVPLVAALVRALEKSC